MQVAEKQSSQYLFDSVASIASDYGVQHQECIRVRLINDSLQVRIYPSLVWGKYDALLLALQTWSRDSFGENFVCHLQIAPCCFNGCVGCPRG